jgi:hypothetical protein
MANKARGRTMLRQNPRYAALGATNMTGFELLIAAAMGVVALLRTLLLCLGALGHAAARLRGRSHLRTAVKRYR